MLKIEQIVALLFESLDGIADATRLRCHRYQLDGVGAGMMVVIVADAARRTVSLMLLIVMVRLMLMVVAVRFMLLI